MPQENRSVQPSQRFQDGRQCPVCGGSAESPRHEGVRCIGYVASSGGWVFCSREEYAGQLKAKSDLYRHAAEGACPCGHVHAPGAVEARARHRADVAQHRAEMRPMRVVGRTRYYIRDSNGKLVAIHHRRDYADGNKEFSWESPEGIPRLGMKPEHLPLYGIESLKDAPADAPVFLVEGQKARDALVSGDLADLAADNPVGSGLVAVATVTGASVIPTTRVLRTLRGRTVVLWPDHEDKGRDHMASMGGQLTTLGIRHVTFTWGQEPGDDAADYFARGGTAAELLAQVTTLIASADVGEEVVSDEAVELARAALAAGDLDAALGHIDNVARGQKRQQLYEEFLEQLVPLEQHQLDHYVPAVGAALNVKVDTIRAALAELTGADTEPSPYPPPVPWAEEVDGLELAELVEETLNVYVIQPEHNVVGETLWCISAHAHNSFDTFPMGAITSPTMRCGKSRLQELLSMFLQKVLLTSNLTGPVLFRAIEEWGVSLVIDEAERFITDENHDLTGILNAGHTKATASVLRNVGDNHKPKLFSTWGPKLYALIGKLPATLMDRSIEFKMKRRKGSEPVAKLRRRQKQAVRDLKVPEKIARWVADHLEQLQSLEDSIEAPDELNDRAADNWIPLLAVAELLGGEWPARARAAALALSGADTDEDDAGNATVLRDVLAVFEAEGKDKMATATILNRLSHIPGSSYKALNKGQGMTSDQLSKALRGFGAKPKKYREGVKTVRGYTLADFEDASERYLRPEPEVPQEPEVPPVPQARPVREPVA